MSVVAGEFHPRWKGINGVFGGYVLARFADATTALPGYTPVSLTIQFIAAVKVGESELRSEVLHAGRRSASIRLEVWQESRIRAHAVAILVPPGQRAEWSRTLDLSDAPAPADAPVHHPAHEFLTYVQHLEMRQARPASLAHGSSVWIRLRGSQADAGLDSPQAIASVFLDALQPGLFAREEKPWFVPTVDFTAHFAPELGEISRDWYFATNETVWTNRDYCVEESTLARADGTVVAQVRQSRSIRWTRPD